MHIHILGICGTFMGGIAALAKAAGHRVSGSDENVYPPMSTQLEALGVDVYTGYDEAQFQPRPDMVVIGNAMSRGNPAVEFVLNAGLDYASGPQWLAEQILRDRWVLAVAGTHGKTTGTSILAWILEFAGHEPGFLIGGVPGNFATTARLGEAPFFVIEADEYDTAFFDKRAKFVHYRPNTLVLNNLEFDHADIYSDLAAIEWQFHQLLRTVPGQGRVIVNAADKNLAGLLARGCWSPVESFRVSADGASPSETWAVTNHESGQGTRLVFSCGGEVRGEANWSMPGSHNAANALAAVLAAHHAGVSVETSIEALESFAGVKRRQELLGAEAGVAVYDDFAHHPTAIAETLTAIRPRVASGRLIAVLEPRSNSMKLGAHKEGLAEALSAADRSWVLEPPGLGWDLGQALEALGGRAEVHGSVDELLGALAGNLRPGDHVVIMSNGSFGGLHGKLLNALGDDRN